MKTSELEGIALDWVVAKCEGLAVYMYHDFLDQRYAFLKEKGKAGPEELLVSAKEMCGNVPMVGDITTGEIGTEDEPAMFGIPAYSDDWKYGGPIIEREKISVFPSGSGWGAQLESRREIHHAHTPLTAAMLCYVKRKLGDDVLSGELI